MNQKAQFFYIKSFTNPKTSYVIRLMPDGQWFCNCSKFVFQSWRNQKDCKHIIKAKEEYEKNNHVSVNN